MDRTPKRLAEKKAAGPVDPGRGRVEQEVGPVMKVLQDNGVQCVALHSHAFLDVPRRFCMPFWANDDAVKLATILRSALDNTNSMKGQ
jgi:hypothetical protein